MFILWQTKIQSRSQNVKCSVNNVENMWSTGNKHKDIACKDIGDIHNN